MTDTMTKIMNPATGRQVLRRGRIGAKLVMAEIYQTMKLAHAEKVRKQQAEARKKIGFELRTKHWAKIQNIERNEATEAQRKILVAVGVSMKLGANNTAQDLHAVARQGISKKLGGYHERIFDTPRRVEASTLADVARTMKAAVDKTTNPRQIIVSYENVDGEVIRRTITAIESVASIKAALAAIQDGSNADGANDFGMGSDAVGVGYSIITSSFSVGSVKVPSGAGANFKGISKASGTMHRHFKLTDFSKKYPAGDCFFGVARAVAKAMGLVVTPERNHKIRVRFGMPPAPQGIEASPFNINALGQLFGLYIRIITGMAVPIDSERVYDDCATRLFGRNVCNTIAGPVVIAESENIDAPPCDIYLSDNHYQYISRVLEPIHTCRITGDILNMDTPATIDEIRARLTQQNRSYYADHLPAEEDTKDTVRHNIIVVYDYETIYTENTTLEPYALGFIKFDPLTASDDMTNATVSQVVRKPDENRFAVTRPLLDMLENLPTDVDATLVSFNGARFDHFLLAEAANHRGMLSDVFATSGGGLRSLKIGRHTTLDLAKLLPAMSLASACKGFNTMPKKVEGFSHTIVQRAYESGELYNWLDANAAELTNYLAGDVLSEASLFLKLSRALTSMTNEPIYGRKCVQTIGGHAWSLMSTTCNLPKRVKSVELDKDIRSAIVGGRVQVYSADGSPMVIEEPLRMLDFASLYPTAMAAVPKAAAVFDNDELWGYYPAGAKNSEPEVVHEFIEGCVGLYDITIHTQPPNLPNVLPRRGETLDWSYRGEFLTKATHTDITLIRKFGGSLTVHGGLVWRGSEQGLFKDFIMPLAAAKDEQDVFASTNDERSNPAMRMCLKLLMNSASGKCCQRNYDDEMMLATGTRAQLAAENKMDLTKPREYIPIGGETCLIVGKKRTGAIYKRTAKPSILAVLIYSYSRALVWRTLCQHNVLYSDTDSGLFRMGDYHNILRAFPQLDPTGRTKELGDLEQELPPHHNAKAYLMAPKDYAVFVFDETGNRVDGAKIRVKGVNLRSDRLLNSGLSAAHLGGNTLSELTAIYNAEDRDISAPLSDISVVEQLFSQRAAGGSVLILSSQLVRNINDSTGLPLTLAQRFLVKHLKCQTGEYRRDPVHRFVALKQKRPERLTVVRKPKQVRRNVVAKSSKPFTHILCKDPQEPEQCVLGVYNESDLTYRHVIRDEKSFTYSVHDTIDTINVSGTKHEVMVCDRYSKLAIDIDAIAGVIDSYDVVAEMRRAVLEELCLEHPDESVCVDESDLYAYESNGVSKRSYHFILQKVSFANHHEQKQFMNGVITRLPKVIGDVIDFQLYKDQQQLRLLGSTKTEDGEKRTKRATAGTPNDLAASMMYADYGDHNELEPRCIYVDHIAAAVVDVDTEKILARDDVRKMMGTAHEYRETTSGGLLVFTRLEPSYCKICKRTHDGDNTLMLSVSGDKVVERCRHAKRAARE
jgi:hypothetical protein